MCRRERRRRKDGRTGVAKITAAQKKT